MAKSSTSTIQLPANLSPSASYDPIVREENLYIYSMWAYRVETRAHCLAPRWDSSTPRAPRHIDIEFDESYNAHGTFVQRLSAEPRIPKPEGMQYVPETNAEVHCRTLIWK